MFPDCPQRSNIKLENTMCQTSSPPSSPKNISKVGSSDVQAAAYLFAKFPAVHTRERACHTQESAHHTAQGLCSVVGQIMSFRILEIVYEIPLTKFDIAICRVLRQYLSTVMNTPSRVHPCLDYTLMDYSRLDYL